MRKDKLISKSSLDLGRFRNKSLSINPIIPDHLKFLQTDPHKSATLGTFQTKKVQEPEEVFTVKAKEFYMKGNFRRALELYEKVKEIYLKKDNSQGLLGLYGILGDLCYELNKVKEAILYFKKLQDISEDKQDYCKKIYAFQQLGLCYSVTRDYTNALNHFKLMLQLSWKENNIEMELLAYDYMSMQYFYMGDLEGARYYHNRAWKGITEKINSPVREISNKALEAIKNREKIPTRRFERSGSLSKNNTKNSSEIMIEIGLPSPRTSSGVSDQQYLPVPAENKPETLVKRGRFQSKPRKIMNKTMEVKKKETVKKSVKPFILLSHLSPIESVKNFFYVDQVTELK